MSSAATKSSLPVVDCFHFSEPAEHDARSGDLPFVYWESVDIKKLFKIVEWSLNFEWLFRCSAISDGEKLELGILLKETLLRDQTGSTRTMNAKSGMIRSTGSGGLGKDKVMPEYAEERSINAQVASSALRDIWKWQYQMSTGERWSIRNRGARRGSLQLLNIWEHIFKLVRDANYNDKRLLCSAEDKAIAYDLNEILGFVQEGRHNKDARTAFCRKMLDIDFLKRVKRFVDIQEE